MRNPLLQVDVIFHNIFSNFIKNRRDAIINDTQPSDHILSELYPRIHCPPLPSPLNFSTLEGSYTHPAYPELRISSSCTGYDRVYKGLDRTTPDLCASLARYNEYTKDMAIDFSHMSGTYWLQIAVRWGVPSAARVEFLVSPDGSPSWLGIQIQPLMASGKKNMVEARAIA